MLFIERVTAQQTEDNCYFGQMRTIERWLRVIINPLLSLCIELYTIECLSVLTCRWQMLTIYIYIYIKWLRQLTIRRRPTLSMSTLLMKSIAKSAHQRLIDWSTQHTGSNHSSPFVWASVPLGYVNIFIPHDISIDRHKALSHPYPKHVVKRPHQLYIALLRQCIDIHRECVYIEYLCVHWIQYYVYCIVGTVLNPRLLLKQHLH